MNLLQPDPEHKAATTNTTIRTSRRNQPFAISGRPVNRGKERVPRQGKSFSSRIQIRVQEHGTTRESGYVWLKCKQTHKFVSDSRSSRHGGKKRSSVSYRRNVSCLMSPQLIYNRSTTTF